jgi:hypothetical protein
MENWLIDLLKESGMELEQQVRVEDKVLDVSGKTDAILTGIVDGKRTKEVLEVKTKHSKAFWYMQKEGKPMRQHEMQLWLYLYLLKIDLGTILYMSKDDMAILQYVVRLDDEELGGEVLLYLDQLNKAWKGKDILSLELPADDAWQAKYCNYHKKCINDAYLATLKFPE